MALTPDEIRSRQFHLADRGYDRAEVQAFLAEVADQLTDPAATPWPAAEERLLLILDAAQRAVETVRAEASRAIHELAALSARDTEAPAVVTPPPPHLDELRDRLGAALRDVESALGAIDPGAQGTTSSTKPTS
jgi:DivIVA domain-containing protein